MLLVLFCGLWLRFESLQIAVQPHGLVDSSARVHRHPERPYQRLNKLQHQQKLENQRSVGINTDIIEVDVNSQFDETAWLNPYKTPTWADYKTQSEPSLESVELAVLGDLYKSDNTSDTEYIIARERTPELPPTLTETDTSQPP